LPGNCPASLRPTAARPVENIPLQAAHHSGRRAKLFAFPPESRSPSTGFPIVRKIADIVPAYAVSNEAELFQMTATSHVLLTERTEDSARLVWSASAKVLPKPNPLLPVAENPSQFCPTSGNMYQAVSSPSQGSGQLQISPSRSVGTRSCGRAAHGTPASCG
jgi:hypothetical protein